MAKVVLKMHYSRYCISVVVYDTDRSFLMDVVNDLLDEAKKHNVPLPVNPSLSYTHNNRSYQLLDDNALMEMFARFEGKSELHIWIGGGDNPSHVVSLARIFKAIREAAAETTKGVREKLQIRGSVKQMGFPPCNPILSQNPQAESVSSPNPIPSQAESVNHTIPTENATATQSTFVSSSLSLRRSPRLTKKQPCPNVAPSQTTQNPEVSSKSTQKTAVPSQRSSQTNVSQGRYKMPKATAKKRGLFVPKSSEVVQVAGRRSARLSSKRMAPEMETLNQSDSENDDSFEPSADDEVDDDADMTDLEEEDYTTIASLEFIDDGYNPYENTEWINDEDGYSSKVMENGEMYDSQDFGAIRLRPWMLFMDKEHFKDVLREYCIQEGFYVVVVKADIKRYTAECATMNCNWRIHASVLPDGITWAIKSIRNQAHGCVGVKDHNPMATSKWVARKLLPDIRANPNITGGSIQDILLERFGFKMKTSTIYKMKDLALREINGGHDESYKFLPAYCEMIKKTDPGSYAICTWVNMGSEEDPKQFKSIFISYSAQINGVIAGCRSLIGVDGTHLKGNHGGVLLTAVALDGNNEIFPLAVSVVESENKESWSFFFWHLKHILKDSGRDNWTVISDRQKGVEPALHDMWPEASRRFCARHLCKNFKSDYPGVLMHKLFWRVVNATSEYSFKKAIELVIQHGGRGAAKWLLDLGEKELWTKHMFDPSLSAEDNTSNFVESYNSTLGIHRTNPILTLLEGIRRLGMVRHATRQQIADSWDENGVCPNILNRIRVLTRDAGGCTSFFSVRGEFEVKDGEFEVKDGRSYLPVSLNNRTCICGAWQISGIPCKHAIRAIIDSDKEPSDFVSEWFTVKKYKEAYSYNINPMPDSFKQRDHFKRTVTTSTKSSDGEQYDDHDDGVVGGHPTLRFYSPPPSPQLDSPDNVHVSDELGFTTEDNDRQIKFTTADHGGGKNTVEVQNYVNLGICTTEESPSTAVSSDGGGNIGVAAVRNDVEKVILDKLGLCGVRKCTMAKSVSSFPQPPTTTVDSSRLSDSDDIVGVTAVKNAEEARNSGDDVKETEDDDEVRHSSSIVTELKLVFNDYYGSNKPKKRKLRNDRKSKGGSSENKAMEYLMKFLRILGEKHEKLNEAVVDSEEEEDDFDVDIVDFAKRRGCSFPQPRRIG